MPSSSPLVELLRFLDDLHERVERTWWGAVVTDSRFPLLWEANYAAVDTPAADLSLAEVREVLHSAVREAGASHEHVWIMQPHATACLLGDLAEEGRPVHWDDLLRHGPRAPVEPPAYPVEEAGDLDVAFWGRQRSALREFGITEPAVVEQVLRRQREVVAPAGKRWFTAREEDQVAGMGSMVVHGRTAYVDDVVTFPAFRRRGVARSVVAAMLGAARAAGAEETFLFADQPGPVRLYEGLGFEVAERVATSLGRLPGAQPLEARPGGPSRRTSERSTGRGPGRPR
ncbi:MAG: GNAT family N-acetyltransferase [Actinomycetota bacterium]|nr:GNAT family N-acetyltransferase [Actinomycetota bacterium]